MNAIGLAVASLFVPTGLVTAKGLVPPADRDRPLPETDRVPDRDSWGERLSVELRTVRHERYFATIPRRERVQAAAQIASFMTDQLIWMGLFHQAEPVMIANRIKGPAARTQGATHTWNAHEWELH